MDHGSADPRHDIVFRNSLVYDGSGAPPFAADVAVDGERIAAIGTVPAGSGRREIDLAGRALAPGFIDAHTHDDRIVLDAPEMLPKISQGVTTVVAGNCGISLAPVTFNGYPPAPLNLLGGREVYQFPRFADYARAIADTVPAVNVAALVGHSSLRLRTMPDINVAATPAEVDAMLEFADEAMESGAAGFSTGLFYPTNAAAGIDEVAPIAARFAEHGGVYATHMRDEMDMVLESIDEALATAGRARAQLVISHHKCAHPRNWGRTRETLPKLEAAARTQPVNVDVYPYVAGSTNLRMDLVTTEYRIMIAWSTPHPEMGGRDLADIAAEWGIDIHAAARRLDPAGAIYFQMDEADVRRVMGSPLAMIGSDGLPHDAHPHPRLWGTFPRVIGHYARDEKLFPLETAIHKMTGLTAATFRLRDRGVIAPGAYADLVVFDPDTIIDRATYEAPRELSAGIDAVYVNGVRSFVAGEGVIARAGRLVGGKAL